MTDREGERSRRRRAGDHESSARQFPVRPAFAAPAPGPSSPVPSPVAAAPPPYPPPAYHGPPALPPPGPPAAYPSPPPYPGAFGVPPAAAGATAISAPAGPTTPATMPAPAGIPAAPWTHPGTWTPLADVYQEDGDYVVITDVPGIDLDTLDLTWDGGELILEATIRSPDKPERKPLVRERPSGSYYRRIPLGPDLDPAGAVASYCDGILEVRVPRKRRRTRRAHPVRVRRPDEQPT